VRYALWLLAAALPAAAQPKLLINAQVDTRSASAGLEPAFRSLLGVQPQPAWIGYSVPSIRSYGLGCEYVSPEGRSVPGVVHLEPPDQLVMLFRIEGGEVSRIRSLSPDCEIDAGGVPVHWLAEVRPGDSVAFLTSFAQATITPRSLRSNAIRALGMSADPAALDALMGIARNGMDKSARRQAVNAISWSKDPRALAFLQDVLKR